MATQQRPEDNDDDDEIDPTKLLLPDATACDDDTCSIPLQQQHHFFRSIESTVVIRQLPSQGLSFQLWPAATTLVTLLDLHRLDPSASPLSPTLAALSTGGDRPLNILELGSGTGLVGISAAATLGANVTVTDLPHVIPNLQFNVDSNADVLGGKVHVAALRWGEDGDLEKIGGEFDLVLGSDVVYYDHLYEPLLKTLRFVMNKKMVFVMAHLRRWKKDSLFFKRARKYFDVDVLYVDSPRHGSRIGVVVYRFASKGQKLPNMLLS